MAEKFIGIVFNAKSNETFEQNLSPEEILEIEQLKSKEVLLENQHKDKIKARTSALAKLAALGLTEEEISAL
jgi:hypothetical protein